MLMAVIIPTSSSAEDISENEEDIMKQIIELKSEMVFMQYNYNKTNACDMIKNANGKCC